MFGFPSEKRNIIIVQYHASAAILWEENWQCNLTDTNGMFGSALAHQVSRPSVFQHEISEATMWSFCIGVLFHPSVVKIQRGSKQINYSRCLTILQFEQIPSINS